MSDAPNPKAEDESEGGGTYNPSGGIPSHPADPGYGDKDADDATDAADEEA